MKNALQTAPDYQLLMSYRIKRILFVCSSYDQFTIEEGGHIEQQIQREYSDFSLSSPPRFTRVGTATEAMEMLREEEKFDLVITMFNIGEVSPFDFSADFKRDFPDTPLVLLTSFSHEITRRLAQENTTHFDYIFSWQGNADLILAIIKMIEDRCNAEVDIEEFGVQGILLVEDSVRFYSAYLPDLYRILLAQTDTASSEALNTQQRNLQKRARPKILFARTMTEAKNLYDKYHKNLLGVISDVSFPINPTEEVSQRVGLELCEYIQERDNRLPIVLQSSEAQVMEDAKRLGVAFIYKHSKSLLDKLKRFIYQRMAFGEFSFWNLEGTEVLYTVKNLEGIQQALGMLPDDVLVYYSHQNIFSKWLYARGLFSLAGKIKGQNVEDFDSVEALRGGLLQSIRNYRRELGRGVIAEFVPDKYNSFISFARCGEGSLGGKARGLAFVGSLIEQHNLYERWGGVMVTIPRTLAISSGYFDEFMEVNDLGFITSEAEGMEDEEILGEFIGSRLPGRLIVELRAFLRKVSRPLAVRSSSKLEDSHFQPFAGVYSTYMVPRTGNTNSDLRMISNAIKSVYASVFFKASRAYINSTSNVVGEESMGVVLQEMCGSEERMAGGKKVFSPTLSGVARSVDFYPLDNQKAEDGVCDIALGLGKAVVEGGVVLRFSPANPKHCLQLSSMEITLRDTQRQFYAMDMNPMTFKSKTDDSVNLVSVNVGDAKDFRNMRYAASSWDIQNNRIQDTYNPKIGRPLVTFASILKYSTFPLAEIVQTLLRIGEKEMNSPVEIEFAVNLDVANGEPSIFNFLQIRPMVSTNRGETLDWTEVDKSDAILYSEKALGIGQTKGLRTIVYIKEENFDPAKTPEIALEIEEINQILTEQNKEYILVGPGRWGSSDHWLGIPVKWTQISGSRVIVECAMKDYTVDPSQGTHFFQNLTSLGVGYLTINPTIGDGVFNQQKLEQMTTIHNTHYIRAVETEQELYVFVDGKNSKAIIK